LPPCRLHREQRSITQPRCLAGAISVFREDAWRADQKAAPKLSGNDAPASRGVDDDSAPQFPVLAVDHDLRTVSDDCLDTARLYHDCAEVLSSISKSLIERRSIDLVASPPASQIGSEGRKGT
jgi:hypothetical protein